MSSDRLSRTGQTGISLLNRPAIRAVVPRFMERTLFVVSELYYPERVSTGLFMTGIAEGLAKTRRVVALCSRPTYTQRDVPVRNREVRQGVEIHRCFATRFSQGGIVGRIINTFSISLAIAWRSARMVKRGDIVLSVTNPPLLPYLLACVCRWRGCIFILLVHDVYPDVLASLGLLGRRSLSYRLLERVSRRLLRSTNAVVVIGRDMRALVQARIENPAHPTFLIPNWAEYAPPPEPTAVSDWRTRLGLDGKFVFIYAGNIGRTHGLDYILEGARQLGDRPEFHFLIVGSGSRRPWVEQQLQCIPHPNVTLLGRLPDADFCRCLDFADVALISFVPGMSGVSVPSRIYSLMMAGKPILAFADPDSEVAQILSEENVGWCLPPGDIAGFVRAAVAARESSAELAAMGHRARQAAMHKYSYPEVAQAWKNLIDQLAASSPCQPSATSR